MKATYNATLDLSSKERISKAAHAFHRDVLVPLKQHALVAEHGSSAQAMIEDMRCKISEGYLNACEFADIIDDLVAIYEAKNDKGFA